MSVNEKSATRERPRTLRSVGRKQIGIALGDSLEKRMERFTASQIIKPNISQLVRAAIDVFLRQNDF